MFCGKAIFFNLSYSFDRSSLPYYELRRILSNSYLNGWIARSDCPNLMRILGIFFERALLTTLETRRPQNSCRWSWYPTWPGTSFWRKAGDRSLCPNLDWGFKVLSTVYWCKISIIYSRKNELCVFVPDSYVNWSPICGWGWWGRSPPGDVFAPALMVYWVIGLSPWWVGLSAKGVGEACSSRPCILCNEIHTC